MPPQSESTNQFEDVNTNFEKQDAHRTKPARLQLVYFCVLSFGYWHIAAVYGLYLAFTSAKWATLVFGFVFYVMAILGLTAGVHRLWSHKTYKAKLPLQIILMIFNTMSCQYTAINWARDHRLHHKYSDTDADPHNSTRGFFFSHIGWLLVRKHPEVKEKGKLIDISDLYNNPVLKFQHKYGIPLIAFIGFILPTLVPMYFWGETLSIAWHINVLRFILILNVISLINSAAHMWGYKPYDKNIKPVQIVPLSILALGEGFHNYHHSFPWDYRTAELGNNVLNFTTLFIDFFAWIGWAYDLKTASHDVIQNKMKRTGDGKNLWGAQYENTTRESKNFGS